MTFEATRQSASIEDVHEVCNYVDALTYARAEMAKPDGLPLSMRLLCGAHRHLMRGVRGEGKEPGEIRRSQNWVGGSRPGNSRFVPPPAQEVAGLLGDLEKWIQTTDELPPLVRAGLAHVQFETIDPFLDGNGRVGRLDSSKAAQILAFEISDGTQRPGGAIAATSPLMVDIEIGVRDRATLDVACMIESVERTLLVDVSTSMSERMPHEWPAGRHRVRMEFPSGFLNAGRYLVRVGLGRTDGTLIDGHSTDGLSMELVGRSAGGSRRRGVLGLLPDFSTRSLS